MAMVTAMVTATGMRKLSTLASIAVLSGMTMGAAHAGVWDIVPSISLGETATNNVGHTNKHQQSDWITDVSPGITINGYGDRVKLNLDYRLHRLYYNNESWRNNTQNALNAKGTLEALENWLFIDATAIIAQQNRSAFGSSTYGGVNVDNSNNATETRTYQLAPYIKGFLGLSTEYLLRYDYTKMTSDDNLASNTENRQISGHLGGTTGLSWLGWSFDANKQDNSFDRGRDTSAKLAKGTLILRVDPQFRVLLIGGWETNDYSSLKQKSNSITGGGFEWSPTQRTLLSVTRERRFFGDSDNITFTHRTAGTAWKYRQTKDAYTAADQLTGSVGSYYSLLDSMFSAAIPDALARAAYVNAVLLSSGISPDAALQGGFMTTGVTLRKMKELSFALLGVRNTVTFAATRSETRDVSNGTGSGWFLGTDFYNYNNVKQTGASINWSHKLTGLSSLTGSASRLKSEGTGSVTREHTVEKMYTLNFLTQLGPKTTAGLGVRRIEMDATPDYTENMATATLSHRF